MIIDGYFVRGEIFLEVFFIFLFLNDLESLFKFCFVYVILLFVVYLDVYDYVIQFIVDGGWLNGYYIISSSFEFIVIEIEKYLVLICILKNVICNYYKFYLGGV